MAPWLLIASLASVAIQAPVTSPVTGTVRDAQGYPVPGATVTIAAQHTRAEAVTDPAGAFGFARLAAGPYVVSVTMPGFRTRTERVMVAGDRPIAPLHVTLAVAPLATILWVVPLNPVEEADAIGHVRILRTTAPAPCGSAVTTFHEVEVVGSLKGSLERRVMLAQEGAGVCVDADGGRFQGMEQPYRAGDQYVVFLRRGETSFGRLAGPSLTFPMIDGRVTTRGFRGLPAEMTIEGLMDALRKSD